MTDAIEPVSETKKKKNSLNFVVVPYTPPPQFWMGPAIAIELYKLIFESYAKVSEATFENDTLNREKKREIEQLRGKKEAYLRQLHANRANHFLNRKVVRIH